MTTIKQSENKGLVVLSLFDGMSCGMLALNKAGIYPEKYFASEIKPSAIKCSLDNFKEIIQIGDISKVSFKDGILFTEHRDYMVGKIDLLIGGSPCFVSGTKIITIDGYKNIEDVIVGDYVLTHKNKFEKVLNIGSKMSNTIKIKCQGMLDTITTNEHPYYVISKDMDKPYWKEASKLVKGDYLGLPILQSNENKYNLSPEICWIIGRYIADGHLYNNGRHYSVIMSIESNKLEEFKNNVVENKFTAYQHTQSVHRCCFYNKQLVELIEKLNIGKGAINKKISMELLKLPKHLLEKVLEGYMSGDGCIIDRKYQANTISRELSMSLCLAIAKVYEVCTNIYYTNTPNKHTICGREVNQNDIYMIRFLKENNRKKWFVKDNILWLPFKSIEKTQKNEKVYNLEVENDNSYTANNIIVHNCQDFSVANKQILGLQGKKSRLFYHYCRILKEVNPTFFLLENVKMKKEHENTLNSFMQCKPILIDGSLLSGAYRKRNYWTNIPHVSQPKDLHKKLQDILEYGYTDRDKARCLLESDSRPNTTPIKMVHRYISTGFTTLIFKSEQHYKDIIRYMKNTIQGKSAKEIDSMMDKIDLSIFDGVRYLTTTEREKLQGVPVGYCKSLNDNEAAGLLGDGWNVDVLAHIFSFIII